MVRLDRQFHCITSLSKLKLNYEFQFDMKFVGTRTASSEEPRNPSNLILGLEKCVTLSDEVECKT